MRFLQSIRWRLQLWHALLLALVLAGFGVTAWRLQEENLLRRVDQELERHFGMITGGLRRSGAMPGQQPPDRPMGERPPFGFPPGSPPELRLAERDLQRFEGAPGEAFYFVVWLPNGRELARSPSAPAEVPQPERGVGPRPPRQRGTLREVLRVTPPGECILVGRDIRDDLAEIRRFGWMLAAVAGAVLIAGLAVGWWITARSLRPIADITSAANRIASGDLTQRIHTAETSSELGELSGVLNDTFARLQASFARQAQFTADAAHELRTPLAVMLTQSQSALARERPAEEYRESLEACQRAAQRMRRLTESLLTLARLDAGENRAERERCDLDRIAQEAVDLLTPLAREQNLSITAEPTPVHCHGEPGQLGQVVTNLVSNAIHYNRPGGEVHVKVSAENGAAVLTVRDTGAGISAEDLPRIFDRFYRADKSRSNAAGRTGLGLAITKAIVEAHDGTIDAFSEPGHGSTFTVRLPLN